MLAVTITDADLAALIQAATDALTKLGKAADAVAEAVPLIQGSVKEIADAAKNFKLKGPFGMSGSA